MNKQKRRLITKNADSAKLNIQNTMNNMSKKSQYYIVLNITNGNL